MMELMMVTAGTVKRANHLHQAPVITKITIATLPTCSCYYQSDVTVTLHVKIVCQWSYAV